MTLGVLAAIATTASVPAAVADPSYLQAVATSAYNVTPAGFTVELWVRVEGLPGYDPRLIRCSGDVANEHCNSALVNVWELHVCNLSCSRGVIQFNFARAATCYQLRGTIPVDDGQFHHIAGTYDGATMRLYIDGVLDGSLSIPAVSVYTAGGILVVGNSTDYNNPFSGRIDEIRVWNMARTQSQIQAGMGTEIGLEPGLRAYWKLNGDGADAVAGNALVPSGNVTYASGRLGLAADIDNTPHPPPPPPRRVSWVSMATLPARSPASTRASERCIYGQHSRGRQRLGSQARSSASS